MGESHAYGSSFICVSRRHFILVLCSVATVLCWIEICRFVLRWEFLRTVVLGAAPAHELLDDCIGLACYEVFSCFGLKETTLHIRDPFLFIFGAYFFPLGALGALRGHERDVSQLARFLAAVSACSILIILADGVYINHCDAYPKNVMSQSLLQWMPPSPLSLAAQVKLEGLASFPVKDVDRITDHFDVLAWYFCYAGLLAALLAYAAREAYLLAAIVEKGPIGLGAHYGLDQWDEVINHDALRGAMQRQSMSKFIDDARLPLAPQGDAEIGTGFPVYGAAEIAPGTLAAVLHAAEEEHHDWGFDPSSGKAADEQYLEDLEEQKAQHIRRFLEQRCR